MNRRLRNLARRRDRATADDHRASDESSAAHPAVPLQPLTRDREDEILKLAVDRGMVSQGEVLRVTGAHPALPPSPGLPLEPPGIRLMHLVREGGLDPANAAELLKEAGVEPPAQATPWPPPPPRIMTPPLPASVSASRRAVPPPEPTLADAPARQAAGDPRTSLPTLISRPLEGEPAVPPPDGRDAPIPPWLRDFERFRPVKLIGRGGMGEVYKAYDPKLNRHVALKCVRFTDDAVARRFVQEAQSQARITHDHVCEIFEIGEHGQHSYIAMQYIEGATLDELIDELSIKEKVALVRQIALGLHAAHRKGLIHRDIKPANIMAEKRDDGWHAFILDFGLVRDLECGSTGFTGRGLALGTPSYMAPEQVTGTERAFGPWTDTFNLGATLFHLLAGRPPFVSDVPMKTFRMIVEEPAPSVRQLNPLVPRDLDAIVAKSLAKAPADRYCSANDFAQDLGRFLNGDPLDVASRNFLYRAFKKGRKNLPLVIALGVAAVAAAGLAIGAFTLHRQSVRHARLALAVGEGLGGIENLVAASRARASHDVTLDDAVALAKLEQNLAMLAEGGSRVEGLRHAARGRVLLSLSRPRAAARELALAVGSDTADPALGAALAEALADVHELDASVALQLDDALLRRARLLALDRDQTRVEELLQGAAAKAAMPDPFTEARRALARRQWAQAEQALSRAGVSAPERVEAAILRARVHSGQARAAALSGEEALALSEMEAASQWLVQARLLTPSDPGVAEAQCQNAANVVDIKRAHGEPVSVAAALDACDQALGHDPARADVLATRAHLLRLQGAAEASRKALAASMDDARAALKADDATPGAHLTLALAAAELARLPDATPQEVQGMQNLTTSSLRLAEDVAATRDAALLEEATQYAHDAEQAVAAGTDPGESLSRAERAARAFAEAQPEHPRAWTLSGLVAALGASRPDASDDASRRNVQAALDKAQRFGASPTVQAEIASVAATSAAVRVARGWDPMSEVTLARRMATSAGRQPGVGPEPARIAARAELAAADWQISQGLPADAALDHARSLLAEARKHGALREDIAPLQAAILRRLADARVPPPQPAGSPAQDAEEMQP